MSGLNQCNFIGYMAADPESRAMASGDTVTNFRIGVGERWKDKQTGESKEKTEWISCVAWRGLGEVVAKYGHKGMQVYVCGKFTTRKWQDKQGNDRYSSEIQVNEFTMLGKRSDNENSGPRNTGGSAGSHGGTGQQGGTGNQNTGGGGGDFDDDIPF